jgi:ArsR family transcriptional regulator
VRQLIKAAKSLSDETRLRMLNLLLQRECCVCEVMQVLDISQTRASRNLGMLYDAGFLKQRKEGLWTYYSIDRSSLEGHLDLFLQAVRTALNDNPVAVRDLARLKESERLAPQCCPNVELETEGAD